MKKLAMVLIAAAVLTLAGCGSNSRQGNINGHWTAVLSDTNFSFATSLVVNGDGTLSFTNFSFSSNSPCFVSGETESGSFAFTGDFNGNVTGTLTLKVVSGTPGGNTLTLTGAVNGKSITGTWTVTGTGCAGSGNFTMMEG